MGSASVFVILLGITLFYVFLAFYLLSQMIGRYFLNMQVVRRDTPASGGREKR